MPASHYLPAFMADAFTRKWHLAKEKTHLAVFGILIIWFM